jgi:hypothetical protein
MIARSPPTRPINAPEDKSAHHKSFTVNGNVTGSCRLPAVDKPDFVVYEITYRRSSWL